MDYLVNMFFTGVGATVLVDVWSVLRKRMLGTAAPDYGLVGRWLAHMPRGRFRHDSIAAAPAARAEKPIGWTAHYLIGIGFAALPWVLDDGWFHQPTLAPAMLAGIATVAAPFLLMQPAMGAGLAAGRTPHPWRARLQSLITHAIFGVGLYLAGNLILALQPS
jgi:hypothetical protein